MATERQTLLTSSSRRTAPLQAERTDARGAFGDYSGVVAAGRALQGIGQDLNQVHAVRTQAIKQEQAKRFGAGFKAHYEVKTTTEYSKAQRDILAQRSNGLAGAALDDYATNRYAEAEQNVIKGMSESAVAKAFPELYAEVATPEFFKSDSVRWLNNDLHQNQVFTQSLVRSEMAADMESGIDMRMSAIADAEQAFEAAVSMYKQLDDAKGTLSAEQISGLTSRLGRHIASHVRGLADNKDPRTLKMVEKAAKYGWVDNEDRRYVDHALSRKDPLGARKANAALDDIGNLFRKGQVSVNDPKAMKVAAAAVVNGFQNGVENGGAHNLMVSQIIGSDTLINGTRSLFDMTYANAGELYDRLSNPANKEANNVIEQTWARSFSDLQEADETGALKGVTAPILSNESREEIRKSWLDRIKAIRAEITGKNGSRVMGWLFPEVNDALASGNIKEYTNTLRAAYRSFGVPENEQILVAPQHADTLSALLSNTDKNGLNAVVTTLPAMRELYGDEVISATVRNLARDKDTPAAVMAIAHMFPRVDEKTERTDTLLDVNSVDAVMGFFSQEGQDKLTRDEYRAPVSQITDAIFSGSIMFGGTDLSKTTGLKFSNISPLAQAAGQAGLTKPVENFVRALALQQLIHHNGNTGKAYSETKRILSAQFTPLVTNGVADAASVGKVYQLVPTFRSVDSNLTPLTYGSKDQGEYAADMSKVLDAHLFARRPRFGQGAFSFWASAMYTVDAAQSALFGGPGIGFNPERGNLSMAFADFFYKASKLREEGYDVGNDMSGKPFLFNSPFGDFASVGVLAPDGEHVPIVDAQLQRRENLGLIYVDLPQNLIEMYKQGRGNKADLAQLTLQNSRVAWIYHDDGYFYAQVPSRGASGGFVGQMNNLGPRVQLYSKQSDGKVTPVRVKLTQIKAEAEALRQFDSANPQNLLPLKRDADFTKDPRFKLLRALKQSELGGRMKKAEVRDPSSLISPTGPGP